MSRSRAPPHPPPPPRYEWTLCFTPAFTHWYNTTPAARSLHATALSLHAAFICVCERCVCVCEELDPTAHILYLLFGTGVWLLGSDRDASALHSCAATLVFPSSVCFCRCPAMIRSLCCALLLFDAMLLPRLLSEVSARLMMEGWGGDYSLARPVMHRAPPPSEQIFPDTVLKGNLLCKIMFEHQCMSGVCVHNHTIMVKIHPLLFNLHNKS